MNNNIHTKVGPSGRVIIPSAFRKQLQLDEGDNVILHLKDNSIEITTAKHSLATIQKLVKEKCEDKSSLVDELLLMRRNEAEDE